MGYRGFMRIMQIFNSPLMYPLVLSWEYILAPYYTWSTHTQRLFMQGLHDFRKEVVENGETR